MVAKGRKSPPETKPTPAASVPFGVPFPLYEVVLTWGKGDRAHRLTGEEIETALAFLYDRAIRSDGWNGQALVGSIVHGLGLATELLSEQKASLAIDPVELDHIMTALGQATADYADRLLARDRGLNAIVQRQPETEEGDK